MTLKLSWPSFFQHLVWLPLRIFMRVCCSARIEGTKHVKKLEGNVIFASNHATELDPLLIVASLPFFSSKLPIIYVVNEKSDYRSNWTSWRRFIYGGQFFSLIGGYEAYKGLNNYKQALRNHLQAMQAGNSVCIFPLGRRHDADEIGKARGGVSYLAQETGRPIVPIHIKGISRDTKPREYLLRKPQLTITFGQPLYAEDIFRHPIEQVRSSDRQKYEAAAIELMKAVVKL